MQSWCFLLVLLFFCIWSSVDGVIADKAKYAHRFFIITLSFYSRSVFHHHHRLPNTERHPFTLLLRQQNALIIRCITWAPRWRWRWQHCIRKQNAQSSHHQVDTTQNLRLRYVECSLLENTKQLLVDLVLLYSVIYVEEEVRCWCDM